MQVDDIKLLYEYNQWANHLMLRTAAQLSPEKLTEPTGFPWGSLKGTLIHILDSENMWRNLIQHDLLLEQRLTETEEFPTLESIAATWRREEAEMRAYLDSLTDSDMDTIVRYVIPEGVRERVRWHCLWHVVNHGMQHRSECAQMLTGFGHSPGGLDFTYFLNLRAGIE